MGFRTGANASFCDDEEGTGKTITLETLEGLGNGQPGTRGETTSLHEKLRTWSSQCLYEVKPLMEMEGCIGERRW